MGGKEQKISQPIARHLGNDKTWLNIVSKNKNSQNFVKPCNIKGSNRENSNKNTTFGWLGRKSPQRAAVPGIRIKLQPTSEETWKTQVVPRFNRQKDVFLLFSAKRLCKVGIGTELADSTCKFRTIYLSIYLWCISL